jgi:hypothetical protein
MLRDLSQKAMWEVQELSLLLSQTTPPPANEQDLTRPGTCAKRGKPVRLPKG